MRFEFRAFCGELQYVGRNFHLDIDKRAARRAHCVIVSVRHPVESARAVAKMDLGDMPRFSQKPKAVVDGRKTDRRQQVLGTRENLTRRQVLARVAYDTKYDLALTR